MQRCSSAMDMYQLARRDPDNLAEISGFYRPFEQYPTLFDVRERLASVSFLSCTSKIINVIL